VNNAVRLQYSVITNQTLHNFFVNSSNVSMMNVSCHLDIYTVYFRATCLAPKVNRAPIRIWVNFICRILYRHPNGNADVWNFMPMLRMGICFLRIW